MNPTTQSDQEIRSFTFDVEELEPPTKVLDEQSLEAIVEQFTPALEQISDHPEKLVNFGYHSFLTGMYHAYAEHRPFVLSPDMLWIVFLQGFSAHIRNKQKAGDSVFPYLPEKRKLIIADDRFRNPDAPWHEAPAIFTAAIDEHTDKGLVEAMRCNFSTTGETERIAGDVTIMEAMSPFFEYIIMVGICGIPRITLEGSHADWVLFSEKLEYFRKYQLDWWIDELQPIVEKIQDTAARIVDRQFWMNLFKVHTKEGYGDPKVVDGWITAFFPFDKHDNRVDIREHESWNIDNILTNLPKQLVPVDFKLQYTAPDGTALAVQEMEFWAGFLGLKQDHNDFTLRPEIGWFVCKKTQEVRAPIDIHQESKGWISRTYYNLTNFPKDVLEFEEIIDLNILFTGEIDLPDVVFEQKIHNLRVRGEVPEDKAKKWEQLQKELYLKDFNLVINEVSPTDLDPSLYKKRWGFDLNEDFDSEF